MSCAIYKRLGREFFYQSRKWSCCCCVRSSTKGVDSNQWLQLQCKLCMNIRDVYFDKSKTFFGVHLDMAFVLTSTIQINIWTLYDFEGIL